MVLRLSVLLLVLVVTTESFQFGRFPNKNFDTKSTSLTMTNFENPTSLLISGLAERFGIIPLCVEGAYRANKFISGPEAVKGTTIDDPTAGMNSDEITNYISNVGGGSLVRP